MKREDVLKMALKLALNHVSKHYPDVVQVFFGIDGSWLFTDESMEAPSFGEEIDVSILIEAADAAYSLKGFPCAFSEKELT